MSNEEFLSSVKEGDFIVCERNIRGKKDKLIACFDSLDETNEFRHYIKSKFYIGFIGLFVVGANFHFVDEFCALRKATMSEVFTLVDELRKNGYRYNRIYKTVVIK